jgi:hypothetical protein
MNVQPSVTVDGRDQEALLRELEARQAGYVPEWRPGARDPGAALQAIAARFGQAIVQRLEQAPEKNKLAFLDMLGQRLSPARAARAPIVFQLAADASGGAAPSGTAVAAPPPPGSSQQVVFETEAGVGLTPGRLVQVFSLWPGRDEYVNHSADLLAGRAVRLFDRDELTTTPHHLYLAHPVLLNLQGNVVLSVEFQLLHPAGEQLEIAWEYWDGEVWRGFATLDTACQRLAAQQDDATNGLTVSGLLKLRADCAKSDKTSVNGLSNYWIRGRLTEPMPPDPAQPPPEVESIRISSLVSHPLIVRLGAALVPQPPPPPSTQPAPAPQDLAPQNTNPSLFGFIELFPSATVVVTPPTLKGSLVNEAGHPIGGAKVALSDPQDVSFGTLTATTLDDGTFTFTLSDFGAGRDMQFDVAFLDARASAVLKIPSASSEVRLTLKLSGLAPTKAYNDGTKLDTTKPFYPFGQQPQPGTVFYFSNGEIFSKPGARFRLYLPRTSAPSDNLTPTDRTTGARDASVTPLKHLVVWEYWNGREWAELMNFSAQSVRADFETTEILDFRVPLDMVPTAISDDVDLWMRARLLSGGYGFFQKLAFRTGAANTDNNFRVLVTQPPILAAAALGYSWQFGPFHPEAVVTFNDFRYEEHTYEATWPGSSFRPFHSLDDMTPALYLGFDKQAPVADIGLFFDIVERASGEEVPHFTWEYWDGFAWQAVPVVDETTHLTAPGILSFIAAADSTALARFGEPLFWLRGRLKEDGPPPEVAVAGIHPNAVWALQQRTFADVPLGTSSGQPAQVFRVAQTPVIPGERLEVLELSGARANVEWRLVALELSGGTVERVRRLEAQLGSETLLTDIVDGDLRLRRDKQKRVAEVWVRWYSRENLFFSTPTERHYAIDRARDIVFFGDGVNGRVPPLGATVSLRAFQSGGGSEGNVAARAVTQLLGSLPGVQAVFNPRAAEGGSDGETLEAFRRREASSAVAVVKAIANRNPAGRRLPGWLTIFVIPESQEPRPYPSRGLRDEVLAYVGRRAPAGLAEGGYIHVTGPTYFPVDISATIVPEPGVAAGLLETRARASLVRFLHPLHGGPSGEGWDFGRGVYLSDVATVLEAVEGLDYAESIQLLVDEEVRGEFVAVPHDLIVVAGTIRLTLKGARG